MRGVGAVRGPIVHRERFPIFWWLGKLSYTRFIARELTSLAVVYTAGGLAALLWTLGRGEEAYRAFLEWLAAPAAVAFHALVLAAVVFHALTWFHLAPTALVVRLRGRKVPDGVVVAGHYAAWLLASVAAAWWLLGGRG